jgi:type I restriction enzyme S subunit
MSDDLLDLPEGWTKVQLSELGIGRTEGIIPADFPEEIFELWSVPTFITGKAEIIKGSEIGSSKQIVKSGDVLLCKINPRINRVWKVGEKTRYTQIASPEWIVFQASPINSDFLVYSFQEKTFRDAFCADVSGVGGSLIRARPQTVAKLKIPLPPLNEQKRIVAKIEELNDRSQTAQKALETIPQLCDRFRQSVLAAAFRGDLTADWREKNPDVEPASVLVGESSNNLPFTWYFTSVGNVIDSLKYGTSQKCSYDVEGVPVLRIPNIGSGIIDHSDLKYAKLPQKEFDELCLKSGDILLIRSNGSVSLVGKTAVVSDLEEGFAYAGYLIRLRINKFIIDPIYLHLCLSSAEIRLQIEIPAKSTSGVHNINSQEVKNLRIPLPPLGEQKQIVSLIKKYFKIIETIEKQHQQATEKLERLNQSILSKAFRGELVPQDPDDEPASVLLERIRTEREKLNNSKPKSKPTTKRKTKTPKEQATIPGLE